MKDWVSLTLNSLLLTQHKSSSPICVRVLNILGSVEKVCFVSSILVTEHLIVLVHDIFDRGFVHEFVDHYGDHVGFSKLDDSILVHQ